MILFACSDKEFTGFSYDPEDVAVTTDKPVTKQKKRSFGILNDQIRVSNEFDGGRLSDFYAVDSTTFRAVIEPERSPINNSPWFSFRLWGDYPKPFQLELAYQDAKHRYHPKISTDGKQWQPLDTTKIKMDSSKAVLTLQLPGRGDGDSLWVSAQELRTTSNHLVWIESLAEDPRVTIQVAGKSALGNPIHHLIITDHEANTKPKGVIVILGRQHPPEVPGDLIMEAFVENLLRSGSPQSAFLERFEVHLFPMLNPDGADGGHWRYNSNGVDLNRDWEAFNQPETRAVRRALMPLAGDTTRRVFYHIDFHATDEHVLYPILPEIEKFPGNITEKWLSRIRTEVPGYPFRAEPFDTTAPIAKNWMFKTFGADGVTFEVYDETDRKVIEQLGTESSHLLMELLNDAYDENY